MSNTSTPDGKEWQLGIWDKISSVYSEEIDTRFTPVIKHLLSLCDRQKYQSILDLGCGTGAVSVGAANLFGTDCNITAVDISPRMLARAKSIFNEQGLSNVTCIEGSAESTPVDDNSQELILSSLCLMFALDRASAASEIKRALKPSGQLIAAVWGSRENTDIVRFQEIAGSFGPTPPVKGSGPGALGDPQPFVSALENQGLQVSVEAINTSFVFENFESAWDTLAGVTARGMDPETVTRAKAALTQQMWPNSDEPRTFNNRTQYIVAR
jgi:SAM-dependent methyltransferase